MQDEPDQSNDRINPEVVDPEIDESEADDAAKIDEYASRQEAALAALRSSIEANSILIYKPEDLHRAIRELEGDDDGDYLGPEDERPRPAPAELTSEDRNRLQHLQRIARGPLGPRRRLIAGSERMLDRVEAVKTEAPHFARFVDLVARAVGLSMATNTPLRLPPILLLGAPGIGKTFVLKRVAAALDSHFELFPMNMLDTFRLRGLNTAWRGARTGKIAEALLASSTACPVILLDEFEKAPQLTRDERPYDVFHTLLEEENSEAFVDDFLELPLRADHIIWIGSANSTAGLPDSIVDRMLIMEIPAPERGQLARIVDGIYMAARDRYEGHFAESLRDEVRDLLARHNPRQLKRIVALALGFAVAAGRDALAIQDVERAVVLAGEAWYGGTFRHPVGFTGNDNLKAECG